MTKEILYNMVHSEKFLINLDSTSSSSDYCYESHEEADIT